ncbi:unnamed protein product [Prorocentrum cordatum]|uniref:Uncharacterized protein n=1 Tax=Prorocentrum cordatum TaxID=2364126 RepID=A0ABN9XSD8_9DINO|nr:unnamed protein product [Polarella glacialis]
MNPCAVEWAKMLCELVCMSETPQEFTSRLFARDVAAFEQDHGQLTRVPEPAGVPGVPPLLAVALGHGAAADGRGRAGVFGSVGPLPGGPQAARLEHARAGAVTVAGSRTARAPAWVRRGGFPATGSLPSCTAKACWPAAGRSRSARRKLQATPVRWASGVDFPRAAAGELLPRMEQPSPTVVVVHDGQFSSGFAPSMSRRERVPSVGARARDAWWWCSRSRPRGGSSCRSWTRGPAPPGAACRAGTPPRCCPRTCASGAARCSRGAGPRARRAASCAGGIRWWPGRWGAVHGSAS